MKINGRIGLDRTTVFEVVQRIIMKQYGRATFSGARDSEGK
jgi:hypothetical protein